MLAVSSSRRNRRCHVTCPAQSLIPPRCPQISQTTSIPFPGLPRLLLLRQAQRCWEKGLKKDRLRAIHLQSQGVADKAEEARRALPAQQGWAGIAERAGWKWDMQGNLHPCQKLALI